MDEILTHYGVCECELPSLVGRGAYIKHPEKVLEPNIPLMCSTPVSRGQSTWYSLCNSQQLQRLEAIGMICSRTLTHPSMTTSA